MTLEIVLLAALVVSAVTTVMVSRLLYAAILLASTSSLLTVIMFVLGAPLAAVFELSVCAGLIPAIFIAAISLTRRLANEDLPTRRREQLQQYWPLVAVVLPALALGGWMVLRSLSSAAFAAPPTGVDDDARIILWTQRHLDLIGQIVILTAAAFGVVALVKGEKSHG